VVRIPALISRSDEIPTTDFCMGCFSSLLLGRYEGSAYFPQVL